MASIKNIRLGVGFCLMCGKLFVKTEDKKLNPLSRTKHHVIPKTLKPKYNVLIPLHLECHKKLNGLYTNQKKKKTPKIKGLNYLKSRAESLSKMSNKFDKRVNTILEQINEDLEKLLNDK